MPEKIFFVVVIFFLLIQQVFAESPDLTFNIPHTKSKADVYKKVVAFFEQKGSKHNFQLGSNRNFKEGSFDVFSFYKCDAVSKSYKLNVVVSERNVMLHYHLPKEKHPDVKCINRTYDRWIELKDSIALKIDSLKNASAFSIPPDVPAGLGFKNIPFGIHSDSVHVLLEMSGYLEGDNQVSLHPKFHENYFEQDTADGKKSFTLIIKLGEYISRVRLGFTPDDKFFIFQIELPSRTAEFFEKVRDKDCLFLTDVFSEKYGKSDTTYKPEKNDITPSANSFVCIWERERYTVYTALTSLDAKYFTVGVVKSKPLEEAVKKLQRLEKEDKLKSASKKF
jgi:hypothetical protein